MKVEEGKIYTCETCHCELTSTKAPTDCPGDCNLSCCGSQMIEKS